MFCNERPSCLWLFTRSHLMPALDRRRFLQTSAVGATALAAATATGAADRPNEKIRLAVMGLHGRGKDLVRGFAGLPDVEIAYLCDPDANVIAAAMKEVQTRQKRVPTVEKD